MKYDKQYQQGKAAFNERHPHAFTNKNRRQGAQEDLKQKRTERKQRKKINDCLTGSQSKGA
jgi:hypothetical protein